MEKLCPPSFLCPINTEIMRDPVVCADGHSYERDAIHAWLQNQSTSPLTRVVLRHQDLTPNHALRNSIEEWIQKNFNTVARSEITLGRAIGTGSFKSVFEGTYRSQRVAVLKLRAGTCDTEAATFAKLRRSPGLVQYLGMCTSGQDQFILTELADHGSLEDLLEHQPVHLAHKLVMMQQVKVHRGRM